MQFLQESKTKLRLASLFVSAVFLFFLIELMPHRVHHMFEEDAENPCIAFTISKGCSLSASSTAHIALAKPITQPLVSAFQIWISYLSPSPFLKRGPPVA